MVSQNLFLNFRIKSTSLSFIFLFLFFSAQNSQQQEFLQKTATGYYPVKNYTLAQLDDINKELTHQGELEKAIKFNFEALKVFQQNKNSESIVASYITIGGHLASFNKLKESLQYLDQAKKELKKIKNPILTSRLYIGYGGTYSELGLYQESNKNLNLALQYTNKITEKHLKTFYTHYSYSWKLYNFQQLGLVDSMNNMRNKCLKLMPDPTTYTDAAEWFIDKKIHLDSAEYYLNKASILTKTSTAYEKASTLQSYGNLYSAKGEYKEALAKYEEALTIFQKMKEENQIRNLYEVISKTYKALHNDEKSNEYLDKYATLSRSIKDEDQKTLNLVIEDLLKEKEGEKKKEKQNLYLLFSVITVAFVIILYFLRKRYLKKTLKKDELIEKKNRETGALKLKVNDSFEEIIQLMESRSPLFLTRFKEVYPEFYEKLVMHTPELTEHDIKFSAYLRLNLTSKEICQYENISLRGIETKRYRLKKKLKLSKETDLQKWILEL